MIARVIKEYDFNYSVGRNKSKLITFIGIILGYLSQAAAQITGSRTSMNELVGSLPSFLSSPMGVKVLIFLFVWVLSYGVLSIVLRTWASLLSSVGGSGMDLGDTLEKVLLGGTGTSSYGSASGGRNLLLWITLIGNLILVYTVQGFLGSVVALIKGFGVSGLLLLGLLIVGVIIAGFLFVGGGILSGIGITGSYLGSGYDDFKKSGKGAANRAKGGLAGMGGQVKDAISKATSKYNQFRSKNENIQKANKKVDGLLDQLGWTQKPCPSCGNMNGRGNDHCGNCGYDFYQP